MPGTRSASWSGSEPRSGSRPRVRSAARRLPRSSRPWPRWRSGSRSGATARRSAASSARRAGRLGAAPLVAGTLRRGGTRVGTAALLGAAALVVAALAFIPIVGYLEAVVAAGARRAAAQPRARALRRPAHARARRREAGRAKPVVLVVIDGLTPSMFEAADDARAPLPRRARRVPARRSVFPSLTPVCLSSIATGAYPDVHEIPHLVWWHRGEQRLVEYGSSFGAVRAAGTRPRLRDTVVEHEPQASLEGRRDGLRGARGRGPDHGRDQHHRATAGRTGICPRSRAAGRRTARGASSSTRSTSRDPTGAPIAVRNRSLGSIDAYAAAVGRWLVTRDGFDLLVYYLPDYDFASHPHGPDAAHEALARSRRGGRRAARRGRRPGRVPRPLRRRLCSDHGQTHDRARSRGSTSRGASSPPRTARRWSTPTIRARSATSLDARAVGRRTVVARGRRGSSPGATATRISRCSTRIPDGRARVDAALRNPNAGEVLVSAAPGWEFVDLAGRHHAGGGSHGSLDADGLRGADAHGRARRTARVDHRGSRRSLLDHFRTAGARAA